MAIIALYGIPRADGRTPTFCFNLAGHEPRRKRLAATNANGLATKLFQRAGELVDGFDRVELGHLLFGKAERAIVVAEIVDECDAHQTWSGASGRSAPTVPSGSA